MKFLDIEIRESTYHIIFSKLVNTQLLDQANWS